MLKFNVENEDLDIKTKYDVIGEIKMKKWWVNNWWSKIDYLKEVNWWWSQNH